MAVAPTVFCRLVVAHVADKVNVVESGGVDVAVADIDVSSRWLVPIVVPEATPSVPSSVNLPANSSLTAG